jgi:hypothetical protein
LSNNIISDLSSLEIHYATSQHTLAKLKVVNLSQNQLPSATSLLPLARTAKNLEALSIDENPLIKNLNFLYEIFIMFPCLRNISCGEEIPAGEEVR